MGKSFDVGYQANPLGQKKPVLEIYQETAANVAPDLSSARKRRHVFRNAIEHNNANAIKQCLDKGLNPNGPWWEFSECYYEKIIEKLSDKSNHNRSKTLECLNLIASDERVNFGTTYTFKEEWALNYSNPDNKGDAVAHVIYASYDEDICEKALLCLFQNETARVNQKHIDLLKSTSKYQRFPSLKSWDRVVTVLKERLNEEKGLSSQRQPALKT